VEVFKGRAPNLRTSSFACANLSLQNYISDYSREVLDLIVGWRPGSCRAVLFLSPVLRVTREENTKSTKYKVQYRFNVRTTNFLE